MRKYFGTDGVRGVANSTLTPELAYKLARTTGFLMSQDHDNPTFVIGRDTRLSGELIESAVVTGLLSVGVNVTRLGIIPTPAVALLTRKLDACGGVMISASHNPFEDNGIKFFNSFGFKLDDELELKIEQIIDSNELNNLPYPNGRLIGRTLQYNDGIQHYTAFLKQTTNVTFEGLKIVIDCANGAASTVAPQLFNQLGAETIVIHATPDGENINVECGSTHVYSLQETVIREKADIGIAFDGDSDRLIAVDENGTIVDGDQILFACAKMLKQEGLLEKDTVVSTVMSNFGFNKILSELNISNIQTSVGDRYVLEEMLKDNLSLGGEQSGHIIFLEHNSTGDGILSAIQLISAMIKSNQSLSELVSKFVKYPQLLSNLKVQNKTGWETNVNIMNEIKECEALLNGNGRILVRASGTENIIRVMVEGETKELVDNLVNNISNVIIREIC